MGTPTMGTDKTLTQIADAMVIEDLANGEAAWKEGSRQKTLLIADLWVEVQQWRSFAQHEYHKRIEAERLRDLAYARMRGRAA